MKYSKKFYYINHFLQIRNAYPLIYVCHIFIYLIYFILQFNQRLICVENLRYFPIHRSLKEKRKNNVSGFMTRHHAHDFICFWFRSRLHSHPNVQRNLLNHKFCAFCHLLSAFQFQFIIMRMYAHSQVQFVDTGWNANMRRNTNKISLL